MLFLTLSWIEFSSEFYLDFHFHSTSSGCTIINIVLKKTKKMYDTFYAGKKSDKKSFINSSSGYLQTALGGSNFTSKGTPQCGGRLNVTDGTEVNNTISQ